VTGLILRLITGLALIASNAFFVVSEFALTRIRQLPEAEIKDDPSLRRAWQMTSKLEIYLTACQVGITISSILLGVVAEPAVTRALSPLTRAIGIAGGDRQLISIIVAVLIINLAHTVYGEQVPTYLGVERPKFGARRLAPLLFWWTRLMYPLICVADWLAKASLRPFGVEITRSWTKEEEGEEGEGPAAQRIQSRADLRRQMGDLLTRGRLPDDRRREVLRALEIGSLRVEEVMIPIAEVIPLSTKRSLEENLAIMAENLYVRFPLVSDGDQFSGVIYVPQVLARLDDLRGGRTQLSELATPPVHVQADWSVARVIDVMQECRQELALVESDSEIVGIVTITDTFETIAGELTDPLD
jgi:CBS domain containing-hemolysin-like protein